MGGGTIISPHINPYECDEVQNIYQHTGKYIYMNRNLQGCNNKKNNCTTWVGGLCINTIHGIDETKLGSKTLRQNQVGNTLYLNM